MNIRIVVRLLAVLVVLLAASPAMAAPRAGIVETVSPGEIGRESLAPNSCPVFSWSQSVSASGYRVAIFAVSPSGDPELVLERRFEGAVGSWSPSRENCLERGQSYAWVVSAEPSQRGSVEDEIVWSMPRRFRVEAAPGEEEVAAALEVVERWREARGSLGGPAETPAATGQGTLGTLAGAARSGALKRAVGSASRIPELAEAQEGVGVVSAVRGEVADLTGFTAGLHGLQHSTEDGAGVLGETLSLTGNVKGVYGYTESTGGRGTIGVAAAESGATIGVGGWSLSPDGFGVLGRASAETGIATGVWAESYSVDGRGVTGLALATSGPAHGVLGQTASPSGGALVGVNLANGPDLVLDGFAAGATTTVLREGSLERASGSAEAFDIRNPGGGGMTLTVAGNAVWHAGNDGPGSGLDADTLDGTQAAAFQARVNGTCQVGEAILGVNPDGSVVCYEVPVPPRLSIVDDPSNQVGLYTSIALGTDGYPVISYHDISAGSLKVAKCNDPACAGGDETITTVDDSALYVGMYTSIAVGTDGFPVISYMDDLAGILKVAKCNDPACAGGDETITTVDDPSNQVGRHTSIAVGTDGFPVISYWDKSASALKVAKCNDPACAGGDETITTVDDPANQVGQYTSLAIGTDGLPVISYWDQSASALKVAKCNDPACAGGDESITTVDDPANQVGQYTSIAIGFDGFPVISYRDETAYALKVAKCNDSACAGGDETIATVDDPANRVGEYSSIAVGNDGFPVISYLDETAYALKVAKCNDPACAGADETITTVEDSLNQVGYYTAIAIGTDGFSVISYWDGTNKALKVAKCKNASCSY